ncbi:MAG TPA: MarR family transcriptional regulator [Acidimicrobiales bacterium]|jgi:DNA-binding MarR family transcriptional regulator|nr:MarR family transcriptional regulator [Acidimicrobiales bacterium]
MAVTPAATAAERLGRALDSLVRLSASRRLHSRQAAAAGAAVSQQGFRLLRLIVESGPITPTQLARRSDMDPAVVTRQSRLLEGDGLIERQRDGADGRLSSLSATPDGRRTVTRMGKVLNRHMQLALDDWPPEDVESLALLMGRLVDDLRSIPYPDII